MSVSCVLTYIWKIFKYIHMYIDGSSDMNMGVNV